MTRTVLFASLALGVVSLTVGYALSDWSGLWPWMLLLGGMWVLSHWRGWHWFPTLGLAFAVLAAAVGVWFGVGFGWMFAAVLFSLAAWDLSGFEGRAQFASAEDLPGMEKRHILRLGLLSAGGTSLVFLALNIHGQFGLGWLALLAFMAASGLAQLIIWARQQ